MSKGIRNFWIEIFKDEQVEYATGPEREDGRIYVKLYIRDEGIISQPITIKGFPDGDKLKLEILNKNELIKQISTRR